MAQFCNACGKEIEPDVKFCGSCGAPIEAPGAAGAGTAAGAGAGAATGAGAGAGGAAAQQSVQQFFDKLKTIAQNTPEHNDTMDPADIEKNKSIACVAYIPLLFFVPLVAAKDSAFGRFHANQGLLLLIFVVAAEVVRRIIGGIFGIIFILRWLGSLISLAIIVVIFAYIIVGILNATAGKAKELPFFGNINLIK